MTTKTFFVLAITFVIINLANSAEIQQNVTNKKLKNNEFMGQKILPDIIDLKNLRNLDEMDANTKSLEKFLGLWDYFKHESYEIRNDIPFTLIIPKINFDIDDDKLIDFLDEHIIPGVNIDVLNDHDVYGNLKGNPIAVQNQHNEHQTQSSLNDIKVLRIISDANDFVSIIFIDGFITEDDRKNNFAKRNIQETNRYNEPQRLEMKNVTKADSPSKENRIGHLMTFLAGMKTGTKVFQHFLSKSNLSHHLEDNSYIVLIPSDNAFQRWHPIDWGFYPFSVQDFTENILRNHFIQMKNPISITDVKNMISPQKFKTLGDEYVSFKGRPQPTVNNVTILSDYTLPNGNEVFLISEVLFVSEAVVSRLHQNHKDKETPPLLAFPWFGAQFLSHAFLALERDHRFTQITRFLNTAEVAHFVSGSNYTFFVPTDEAFEKYGFDVLPDDLLASKNGVKMILNHFVKGRLYDRDLKTDEVFETIGGNAIKIQRKYQGKVAVNDAHIIESEIFVYNLGTMFYIDDILYADLLKSEVDAVTLNPGKKNDDQSGEFITTEITTHEKLTPKPKRDEPSLSTLADVEIVPSEFTEQSGNEDDSLFQDEEIVTPRALPVKFRPLSPKK